MYCYNCMNIIEDGSTVCPYCHASVNEPVAPHHLQPGTILDNKYLIGRSIGEGGFGITYIAKDLNLDIRIAIKEFYPTGFANRNNTLSNKVTLNYQNEGEYFRNGKESFIQEARNIKKYSREPGIVDVMAAFEENDTAYFVMEYLDGMNLSRKIRTEGTFSAENIIQLLLPIMRSLEIMHKDNIIHRDISPENIRMLSSGSLTLMDFGSARYYAGMEKKTMSVQFKPGYAPFEQYNKNGNQGPWTDVYGLCTTIYKCITGVTPVDSLERCQNDTLKKPSELGARISPQLEGVLMYGLAIYPDNRCKSMGELIFYFEKAIRGEQPGIQNAGSSAMMDNMNRVKTADGQFKTMYADKTYGDMHTSNQMYGTGNNPNYGVNQNQNFRQNPQQYPQQNAQKKSNKALIAVLISATAAVVIAIFVFTAVMIFMDKGDNDKNDTVSSVSSVKADDSSDESSDSVNEPTTEKISVNMIDVKGKNYTQAEQDLAALGLQVEIARETSDSVAKDCVTRQSVPAGQTVNKGDKIILYVSKGAATNSEPYDQKVVVTASSGSSYAKLALYNWSDGEWVKEFECDATVGKNGGISYDNSESNTLTPRGTFPLGDILTPSNVTEYTVVCDDVDYPQYYNQIMDKRTLPSGASSDGVGKKLLNGGNNALIFIEHNGNGHSSSGVSVNNSSVITICGCYSAIKPTNGCIDISASNMEKLLGLLDESKNPYIITEVD